MRALFVSSEIYPLAKTGGLADVSHALPAALRVLGVDVRTLMPGYRQAMARAERLQRPLPLGRILGYDTALVGAQMPGADLPVWLLDCPELFDREGGLYVDREGRDWPDNHVRFALLARVAARLCGGDGPVEWRPDLAHANDWHAGLLPLLLKEQGGRTTPTLFAIHNMAFQGLFDPAEAVRVGVSPAWLTADGIEFYGRMSYLKAGIRFSDRLVTVSPTYAREIRTANSGLGLEGLLAARGEDLAGILNGVDYGVWDPAHDPLIPATYGPGRMAGKRASKAVLQAELGLAVDPETPLLAYMSRLTEQKMADIVAEAVPAIVAGGAQLAVVAEGERRFEEAFAGLVQRFPASVSTRIGYEERAAHRLLAGTDILLAPARFEPCGLTHLYGMRYGAIPVVRRCGGLADTVVDADRDSIARRTATGFHHDRADLEDFLAAVARATELCRQPLAWRRVHEAAMARDFSWMRSARRYLDLYRTMTGEEEILAPEIAAAEPLRA